MGSAGLAASKYTRELLNPRIPPRIAEDVVRNVEQEAPTHPPHDRRLGEDSIPQDAKRCTEVMA